MCVTTFGVMGNEEKSLLSLLYVVLITRLERGPTIDHLWHSCDSLACRRSGSADADGDVSLTSDFYHRLSSRQPQREKVMNKNKLFQRVSTTPCIVKFQQSLSSPPS